MHGHVRALVRHQPAGVEERDAILNRPGSAGAANNAGIDSNFRKIDRPVQARPAGSRSIVCLNAARIAADFEYVDRPRTAASLIGIAYVRQPFLFLLQFTGEFGRPPQAAVQRARSMNGTSIFFNHFANGLGSVGDIGVTRCTRSNPMRLEPGFLNFFQTSHSYAT